MNRRPTPVLRLLAVLLLLSCSLSARAAIITVTSALDGTLANLAGNGTCDLREAITAANTNSAVGECPAGVGFIQDTIHFNIPGAGPHLIEINSTVAGDLPDITSGVVINGYTQPGSAQNTLVGATNAIVQVGLRRTAGSATNGLHLFGPGARLSMVLGLRITGFVNGILVDGGTDTISIRGNFIGTDGVSALGNNIGVSVTNAFFIRIGYQGDPKADLNLIAGNATETQISTTNAHHVTVSHNLIGTIANGNSPLHQAGSSGVVVAGAATGPYSVDIKDNVIGAGSYGVLVRNDAADISIYDNKIGIGSSGGNLGGSVDGLSVFSQSGTPHAFGIYANTIGNWGRDGIRVSQNSLATPPSGIRIFQNSIIGNGGLAINLADTSSGINTGVDVNDAGDPDGGPNRFQNYPVVNAASANATQTLVAWSLNSTSSTTFTLQFFSSPACSASGNGEGQTYLGSADIATDASGNATGNAILSTSTVGHVLTTTATNRGTHDTSEFSACRTIAAAPPAAGIPPFLDSIPNQTGTVGAAFAFALAPFVSLTEGDPILSYVALSSLPPGLALAPGSGVIAGIPSQPANLFVLVAAIDKDGQSNAQGFTITIAAAPPGSPPVMGNVPDQAGTVGTAFSLDLSPFAIPTNGNPILGYAVASGTLPPGLSLAAATGLISGTPATPGTYNVTVTASDQDGTSNADAIQFVIAAAPAAAAIPTLSEWGLLLLAGLMALVGVFRCSGHG